MNQAIKKSIYTMWQDFSKYTWCDEQVAPSTPFMYPKDVLTNSSYYAAERRLWFMDVLLQLKIAWILFSQLTVMHFHTAVVQHAWTSILLHTVFFTRMGKVQIQSASRPTSTTTVICVGMYGHANTNYSVSKSLGVTMSHHTAIAGFNYITLHIRKGPFRANVQIYCSVW